MNSREATERKRADLKLVVDTFCVPASCIRGVIAVGSVASGHAGESSDIDDHDIQEKGIHLDLKFLSLSKWSAEEFTWPEYYRSGLSDSWIAYDRNRSVERLIKARTAYDNKTRLSRLDEFILSFDDELRPGMPERNWERFGPLIAFGRLDSTYDTTGIKCKLSGKSRIS